MSEVGSMPDKIRALAIGCHPDDIEFAMAGTMLNLQKAGCEIHFMTVANGSLGTNSQGRGDIAARRHAECLEAANLVGAVFHDPICDDIEVFYTYENICRVADVVREVDPSIILTHGPYDYMEDHVCTGKLAVTAAFCRGMTNLRCRPGSVPTLRDVALYHSMPHSITDQLNRPVEPDFYVDVTEEMETKREMLRRHASQKEWNICRVADVVREVDPSIILTHGPYDYMEDHVCTGKLAVTAAFCRGMTNLRCRPGSVPTLRDVALYHSMPHSITDQLNRPVEPDFYVDVTEEMETKREMLRRHASQKEWLDVSQGMDAYLEDMASRSLHYGRKSGCFEFAEGWIRHNPLGFCPQDYNPLVELLGKKVHAADTTDCRK